MFQRYREYKRIARMLRGCGIRRVQKADYHNPTVMSSLPGNWWPW